jgi:hypothetical protein
VQWKLTGIKQQGDGTLSLTYSTPDGDKTLRARTVALTVPAYVAADLLEQQVCSASPAAMASPLPSPPSVAAMVWRHVAAATACACSRHGEGSLGMRCHAADQASITPANWVRVNRAHGVYLPLC